MKEYTNSAMNRAIEEHCHNRRYRELLRLRFCEGFTYEEIAEEVSFSPQHVRSICNSYKMLLFNSL